MAQNDERDDTRLRAQLVRVLGALEPWLIAIANRESKLALLDARHKAAYALVGIIKEVEGED
jgi:hypothetical protein